MTTPAKKPTATVDVTADISQARAEVEQLALAWLKTAPKPGVRTSEFAVTVLTLLVDLLLARFHASAGLKAHDAEIASGVLSALSAVYVAARTWLKAQHVKNVKG